MLGLGDFNPFGVGYDVVLRVITLHGVATLNVIITTAAHVTSAPKFEF